MGFHPKRSLVWTKITLANKKLKDPSRKRNVSVKKGYKSYGFSFEENLKIKGGKGS